MKKSVVKPISFRQAIYNFWTKGLDFRGVATRREYWYCWVFIMVVRFLAGLIAGWLGYIVWIVMLVPCWAVSVRRFHDVRLPGWLYVVPSVCIGVWFFVQAQSWARLAMLGYVSFDFMLFLGLVLICFVFNTVVFLWPSRLDVKRKNN